MFNNIRNKIFCALGFVQVGFLVASVSLARDVVPPQSGPKLKFHSAHTISFGDPLARILEMSGAKLDQHCLKYADLADPKGQIYSAVVLFNRPCSEAEDNRNYSHVFYASLDIFKKFLEVRLYTLEFDSKLESAPIVGSVTGDAHYDGLYEQKSWRLEALCTASYYQRDYSSKCDAHVNGDGLLYEIAIKKTPTPPARDWECSSCSSTKNCFAVIYGYSVRYKGSFYENVWSPNSRCEHPGQVGDWTLGKCEEAREKDSRCKAP